jgi:sigma-54 specific flagellar transcriptional regulator A
MREAIIAQEFESSDGELSSIRRVPALTLRPTSRGKIVGFDPKIRAVLETVDRVARTPCTVLVTGESGTGKELVVAALHDASDRRAAPLVTVNCGAIPLELIESELFGHVRGAFTGAHTARRGVVAAAEGGTLFLDEVGELPLPAQVKLLRLLQQREYTPVGETRAVRCNVRIVAATHRDLQAEVRAGRFREDLFYRLNVIHIRVPALRERGDDVPLLAHHFFRFAVERAGRTDLMGFSESALAAIASSPWPGNVRALENAVERAVLLAAGPYIEADDLAVPAAPPEQSAPRPQPSPILVSRPPLAPMMPGRTSSNPAFPRTLPEQGVNLGSAMDNYQSNLIRQALSRTGGNKNKAARLLNMKRTTLVEIIRRRQIEEE